MSDRDRITDVLNGHRWNIYREPDGTCRHRCGCGWWAYSGHEEHVADALIAAGAHIPAKPGVSQCPNDVKHGPYTGLRCVLVPGHTGRCC